MLIAAAALLSIAVAGCASDPSPGPKQDAGTWLGAITGAVIGSNFGGGTSGHVAGAVAGAAAGGMLGNAIGASLDARDRERAYAAQMQAVEAGEPGAPVGWRSPDSGRHGTIVPGPPYQSNGLTCREFTHTIYVDGRPQTARGTACRNPDGTWTPLG
jgi:surface antigen